MATEMYSDIQVVPHPDQDRKIFEIARLIDDLKHQDLVVRTRSVQSLPEIFEALGQERSRDELLPFISETLLDDEDELLEEAAEMFPKLVDAIGGKKFIPLLLTPLEDLVSVEEPTVREKASESFGILVAQMKKEDVVQHFIPILTRLSEKDWFTARAAACSLFVHAYPKVTDSLKKELRGRFGQLCVDLVPTVRKAAAMNLGKFAQVIDFSIVKTDIKKLFDELSKDSVDSIRIQTFKNVVAIAGIADESESEFAREMLETLYELSNDAAWRVRWTLAHGFLDLAELVMKHKMESEIKTFLAIYMNLLKDREPEVKAAAVKDINKIGVLFQKHDKDFVSDSLVKAVQDLLKEETDFVRAALADEICELATIVGQQRTLEYLLEPFIALLRDPDPGVRMNFIKNLEALDPVLAVKDFSDSLLPSVSQLAVDNSWRTRHGIILEIPLLAKLLGRQIFDLNLAELSMKWLEDEVSKIREAATTNLPKLVRTFGDDWVIEHIVPKLDHLAGNSSYLYRMQALRAIAELSDVLSVETMTKVMVPFVEALSKDPTANIKFNVAKCLTETRVLEKIDPEVLKSSVLPKVRDMAERIEEGEEEVDVDVEYYANLCLEKLNSWLK
eukprot:maker-scaffold_16-snap-gene-3.11-mRNA-1 protein AED:0.20 eAED:0.20 QI:335/1/1/1/0.75/0.55/9/108/616